MSCFIIEGSILRKYGGDDVEVTIPNYVTIIGEFAFADCTGLKSITIPNSVTHIRAFAFQNCSGLISITIPNSVMEIRSYVFLNCSSLTRIAFACGRKQAFPDEAS